jgi:hypothetical protein
MTRKKNWDPERVKAAIKAVRIMGMGSYNASLVVNESQTTLQRYVQDRQKSSSETIKQNWVGSKFFLMK